MLLKCNSLYKFIHFSYRNIHNYIYKMDKAYLRHLSETSQFQITFHYTNQEQKVNRHFNFSRQLCESVSAFLSRVTTNVEKVVNKKSKKKKGEESEANTSNSINAALFIDNKKINEEMICRDVFQENNKVILKLLDKEYEIVINSPFVDALELPQSILANFPVYPSRFECVFTDKSLSDFKWYRSIDKKSWELVGSGFTYTPSNFEIDSFLKLACVPKNVKHEGPLTETISANAINASPGLCPFDHRHNFTKEKCKADEFRVVSYNILADLYCDSDYSRSILYPYCPPYALSIEYRKQLILKELIGFNADIICLQEVDKKVYKYDLEPVMATLNYESHFTLKGASTAEGLCCFYNSDKFRLVLKSGIILSEHLKSNPIFQDIWKCVSTNDKLSERVLERQTAVQIAILESKANGNLLIVANTHLYFHPDSDHIRLLQGGMCIKYVEDTYNKLKANYDNKNISAVFCGDFNSVPDCGIYELYTTGCVGEDCIDWNSNTEEAVKNLCLKQPFKFASACGTPKFTNYTAGFQDCLDYIFYDQNGIGVSQVIPLPSYEELIENTALPSIVFPSDHISLVADLKWLSK